MNSICRILTVSGATLVLATVGLSQTPQAQSGAPPGKPAVETSGSSLNKAKNTLKPRKLSAETEHIKPVENNTAQSQASPSAGDACGSPLLRAEAQPADDALTTAIEAAERGGVDLDRFTREQKRLKVQSQKAVDDHALADVIRQTLDETKEVLTALKLKLPETTPRAGNGGTDHANESVWLASVSLSGVGVSFGVALLVSAIGVVVARVAARRETERVLTDLGLL